jgi:hypothetical protein
VREPGGSFWFGWGMASTFGQGVVVSEYRAVRLKYPLGTSGGASNPWTRIEPGIMLRPTGAAT